MKFLKLKAEILIFFAIIFLGAFFRFYRLDQSPLGLYVDEAAIGYNANSILETGKDEYGKAFPIFFRSFGDYKMPLYIYSSVLPIKIFGLNIFAVRFNSAFFGILTIAVIYFLTRVLFPRKGVWFGLLTALVLAIAPLPVFFSRMGLEVSLALFLLLLALLLQLISFSQKSLPLMILSSLSYAFSAYTYHAERFLAPMLFAFVTLILFFKFHLGLKKILISWLLFLALLSPQIFLFNSAAGQARIKSLENKGSHLKNSLSLYLAYFSPRNLFLDSDPDRQRSLPELSVFYPWMCLPLLIGFYVLLRKKEEGIGKMVLMIFLLLSPIPASLAKDPFSSFRAFPFVFPYILIISLGLEKLFFLFKKKIIFLCLAFLIIGASLFNLWRNVFVLLPNERFNAWSHGYSQLAEEISKESSPKVLINDWLGTSYIEVLFFQNYSPAKYQKERPPVDLKNYYQIKDWDGASSWGRFEVRPIFWKKDVYTEELIVAGPISISEGQAKEHFFAKAFAIIGPDGETIFNGYLTNPALKKADDERKLRLNNESGHL
jgi:4-amino-4-deoxy-L-arabinose transferase-like glycosyltransferase